ncbi:MAG: serine hydrolase domain-containing protein [Candidatus Micrarchaeia archaeon]
MEGLAENSRARKILEDAMAKHKAPGVVAGTFKKGRIVFAEGSGAADLEFGIPANPAMPFRIGSMSKAFTAAAILKLSEKGRLKLDDTLADFFGKVPARLKSITVAELLSHSSGIADYLGRKYSGYVPGKLFDLSREASEQEIFENICKLPVEFRHGKRFSYSNTNYALLGFIIKEVSGIEYYRFLENEIFKPLGMSSTGVHSYREIVYNRAKGYELVKKSGGFANARFVADAFGMLADGALYSSIIDIAKWDAALYGSKLLRKESIQEMFSIKAPIKGNEYGYGFGWFIRGGRGKKLAEHTGSWEGFTSVIARDLDNEASVAIFSNVYAGGSQWILGPAHKLLKLLVEEEKS